MLMKHKALAFLAERCISVFVEALESDLDQLIV